MSEAARYWCVVPAAGQGTRMGGAVPKQYQLLAGRPMLAHTLDSLLSHPRIAGAVVVLAADDAHWAELGYGHAGPVRIAIGGATRADSVLAGLAELPDSVANKALVLVHDAARPCVEHADIDKLLAAAEHSGGALLAAPLGDTLKRAGSGESVAATVDRRDLWRALTPQAFPRAALATALEAARRAGIEVTDEAMAMERSGQAVRLVAGSGTNFKITTPADKQLAEGLLVRRRNQTARQPTMRIGQGIDVHAFGPGDHVMLGGVRVPHDRALVAHSDGDVVIHALCDALLGAIGAGDIGKHFPPSDPRWRDADSRAMLRAVMTMVAERGLALGNADVTVVCEAPKLAPHIDAMRAGLSAACGCDKAQVSIKATTSEKLGFTGRGEGIAANAVVLLTRA